MWRLGALEMPVLISGLDFRLIQQVYATISIFSIFWPFLVISGHLILFWPTIWGPKIKKCCIFRVKKYFLWFFWFFYVLPMENKYLLPNINPEPFSTSQLFTKLQTYNLGAAFIFFEYFKFTQFSNLRMILNLTPRNHLY